jgi:hypothetical protein
MTAMKLLAVATAVVAFAGCKKHPTPEEDPAPPSGPPKVGHATVHLGGEPSAGSNATRDPAPVGSAAPTASAQDDHDDTGTGKPAYRDEAGHVHGPGGPVYMGETGACDASRNHCLRKPEWFAAGNIERGRQFRASPAFRFEKVWYDWRGEPVETSGKLYRTKPVGSDAIAAGTPVIFFEAEPDDTKWATSEYDALTSSRWEAAIAESESGGKVRVSGWGDVPKDTVREIVETRGF